MNQITSKFNKVAVFLATIIFAFTSFIAFANAEIDLNRVVFVRNGSGDITISTDEKYRDAWVKFTLDGSDVTSQVLGMGVSVRAQVSFNGSNIGNNLGSASEVNSAINGNKKAGHYTIKYSADEKGSVKYFADRERDVWMEEGSSNPGSGDAYKWDIGNWGTCKNNVQTRDVVCEDINDNVLPDSACVKAGLGSRPADSRSCDSPVEEHDYNWYTGSWGTCDDGIQYRTVTCRNEYGSTVSNSYCTDTRPASSRTCGDVDDDDTYISTLSATNIDEDSATLRGRVEEGNNVEVWFVLSEDDSTPSCSSSSDRYSLSGTYDDGDDFSRTVSGLDEDETYYFRACGEDDYGNDVSGSVQDFDTDGDNDDDDDEDGDIETLSATSVDEDSATLRGRVEEGDDVEVWFVLSRTDSTPSCTSGTKYRLSGTYDDGDTFSKKVSGLREDEKYYFRACGETDYGDDVSGSVKKFDTDGDNDNDNDGDAPEAETLIPSGIQSNYAILNGRYDSNGEATTVYFEWGRTSALGNTTGSQYKGETEGYMAHGFTNLSPNTTYCYRAVAVNAEGYDRGDIRCFQTLGGSIIIPTGNTDINTLPNPELDRDEATLKGELVRGNNIRTWFALDDSTSVSCRDTSDRTSIVGTFDAVEEFSDTVSNLEPGTTYYFRACGSTTGGTIVSGELRSFVAGGDDYGYGYGLSFIRLDIDDSVETVTKGDQVTYNVTWENISRDDLFDLVLHVRIPKEVSVTGASDGRFNQEENSITLNIDELREGESGDIQIYGLIKSGTEGEAIVAEATMSFDNPINDAKENATDYDDDIYSVYNPFGAAAFTLGNITTWGWLLALLLLILILLIARWLYLEGKNAEKKQGVVIAGVAKPDNSKEEAPAYEQPVSNYIPYRPNR